MLIGFFDTETTGLKAGTDRVIELALLVYDSASRACVHRLVQRFDPECPIHPDALAVHGITYGELVGQPKFRALAADVRKQFESCDVTVAHNIEFDKGMLSAEFTAAGLAPFDFPGVDTMTQARWATPNGKWPKLGELCFALGIDYDTTRAHAAEYDVEVMAQCFFRGLDLGFFTLPAGIAA
jgi:DNA polymerase-3 subunit epsilon